MKSFILALVFAIGLSACGISEESIETSESAIVSVDPCGVTIGPPVNMACTKHAGWRCRQYSNTTHRCSSAHGTVPIPGSEWDLRPPHNLVTNGSVIWYPGVIATGADDYGEDGIQNLMLMPRGLSVPNFSTLYTSGWSYKNTDLSPSGVLNGLQDFSALEIVVVGGTTQLSFCGYRQPNFIDQIGADCFRSPPGIFTDFYVGNNVIKSFQIF